ncbi:MAG: hypothetical protein Q9212_000751 [Teloschistes hypoglaucus]
MAMNVDAKLLKQTKFPPEFNQKVDMQRVNVEVLKKWIAGKISDVLGNEDDVVIELCFNLLEGSRFPNIKVLQIQLTGFLDKDTPKFCKELWTLCLSAQNNAQGVPKELLEAKKQELIQEKRLNAALIRKGREIVTLTPYASESEPSEDEVGEEVTDRISIMTGVHQESQDLLPAADDPHHTPRNIVGAHHGITLTPTSPVTEMGDGTIAVAGRHQDVTETKVLDRGLAATATAARQHPFATELCEGKGEGFPAVVMIVLDPTHLQIYLAHDPPESPAEDAALLCRPAVHPLRGDHHLAGTGMMHRQRRLCPGLALVLDDMDDTRADARKGRSHLKPRRRSNSRDHDQGSNSRAAVKALSRSPSPGKQRERKRHRSIQRYAPAARRRRNSSSVSSPVGKRHKTADSSAEETSRQPPEPIGKSLKSTPASERRNEESHARAPEQTANVLREKLLREKVMALRKASTNTKAGVPDAST